MTKIYLFGTFLLNLLLIPLANAQDYGLKNTAVSAGIPVQGSITQRAGEITGAALSLIGILFFVLMLYGGFLWMTARGDTKVAEKAKGIILDAIIGLIIVAAAYIITSFVFKAVQ